MPKKLLPLLMLLLSGCSVITAESVYEGIRGDQKVKSDRSIPNANELPAYELYRQERETLKK